MNPLVFTILRVNHADLEAIITKIGLPTLLSILPNVLNILKTVEDSNKAASGK